MKLSLLALLATALGCGPSVIWAGHTADRNHRVELVQRSGLQYVVLDGQRRGGFRAIAGATLVTSTSHVAFAARVGARWVAVRDGVASEPWDSIGELVLSATGRLAFVGERRGAWHVIVDGVAGPPFEAILTGTLQFSRDGRRVGYVGRARDGVHAVVDGGMGRAFDGIGRLAFAADGARVAYAARRGSDAHVVLDGTPGPAWRAVGALELSAAGGRVAYAASDGEAWRVVVDGEPGPAVGRVHRIVLRDDGHHVAWVARVGDRDVLAVDGSPLSARPQLRDASIAFRPAAAPGPGLGLAYAELVAQGGERMVIDDVPGPRFDEVGPAVWSARGRLAYAGRRGRSWVMVLEGRELAGGSSIGVPVFSGDGERIGYVARRGRASYVVVDGVEHRFDLAFEDTLVFSRDHRRWVVVAGDLAHEKLFFAIDGTSRIALPAIEIYSAVLARPSSLVDPHPNDLLRAWAQAEADR